MSFSAYGTPCIGPLSTPRAKSASAAAASARARSAVTRMKLSIAGSMAAMRASASSARAADVTEPSRSLRPASAMESSNRGVSVMLKAPASR